MDLATRTGAQRRSEIPRAVLAGLNAGELESVNLVEWLAIDMPTLLRNVAPEVGLADEAAALGAAADALAGLGIVKREKGIGAALFRALDGHPNRAAISEALAAHTSDMVRAWARFRAPRGRALDPAGAASQDAALRDRSGGRRARVCMGLVPALPGAGPERRPHPFGSLGP